MEKSYGRKNRIFGESNVVSINDTQKLSLSIIFISLIMKT